MNLALELFLTTLAVIFAIVVAAEIVWKLQKIMFRKER